MPKFKSHFDLSPEAYRASRAGHFAERRSDLVCQAIEGASDVKAILEIGCGSGDVLAAVAERFPRVECCGIDIHDGLIALAQETHQGANLSFRWCDVASGADLPASINFVYSIDVIHHFEDHAVIFRSIRELVPAGAVWFAIEPNFWHPYVTLQQERMIRSGLDEGHFVPWRMKPILRQSGFDVAKVTFAHALPPAMRSVPSWLARAERRIERTPISGASAVYTLVAT